MSIRWTSSSSAYLGPLGSLVQIPGGGTSGGTLDEESPERYTIDRTITGRVIVQAIQSLTVAPRRTWPVSLQSLPQDSYTGLRALAAGGYGNGPFYWVTPGAQAENLVTPDDSLMTSAPAGWSSGGPLVMPDGTVVDGSLTRSSGGSGAETAIHAAAIPAPPGGGQLTASAWVQGATGSSLIVRPALASGAATGSWTDSAPVTGPGWNFLSLTVNYGATYPGIWVGVDTTTVRVAGLQVVWGAAPVPYTMGAGCSKAIPNGLKRSLKLITGEGAFYEPSFTVVEVG